MVMTLAGMAADLCLSLSLLFYSLTLLGTMFEFPFPGWARILVTLLALAWTILLAVRRQYQLSYDRMKKKALHQLLWWLVLPVLALFGLHYGGFALLKTYLVWLVSWALLTVFLLRFSRQDQVTASGRRYRLLNILPLALMLAAALLLMGLGLGSRLASIFRFLYDHVLVKALAGLVFVLTKAGGLILMGLSWLVSRAGGGKAPVDFSQSSLLNRTYADTEEVLTSSGGKGIWFLYFLLILLAAFIIYKAIRRLIKAFAKQGEEGTKDRGSVTEVRTQLKEVDRIGRGPEDRRSPRGRIRESFRRLTAWTEKKRGPFAKSDTAGDVIRSAVNAGETEAADKDQRAEAARDLYDLYLKARYRSPGPDGPDDVTQNQAEEARRDLKTLTRRT